MTKILEQCQICGRNLDNPADPLSGNCGGDCWGCIGEIEADMGDSWALAKVREEFYAGLRPGWIDPNKPWTSYVCYRATATELVNAVCGQVQSADIGQLRPLMFTIYAD